MKSSGPSRSTYILLVSLMVPMCTVVLVTLFIMKYQFGEGAAEFSKLGDLSRKQLNLIVVGAGICALMAAALDVALMVIYRQRNRFELLLRRQRSFMDGMLEERLRLTRALDVLSASQQVTLAIKQETSFDRIASVVLEQIEAVARAYDVVVFAATPDGELEARARRFNGLNSFGTTLDEDNLELELPYEALIKNQESRHFFPKQGEYAMAIPYATTEGMRGVVLVRRNTLEDPDFERDLPHFEGSLSQLVKSVSVGLKFSAIWDRAIKDEMTGLFNKNHFNKEMPRLCREALKSGKPLTMLMLDIDKFKHVNDTFGHLPGDQVLRQVAGILLENLRTTDSAFRYGGEELCLVCHNTVDEDAARFAERLRSIIAHTEFRTDTGQLIPITASFGVSEFDPRHMQTETDLKLRCDEALYHAKEHGRNQVVIASGKKTTFNPLDRSGDVATEVKRRLGLAGDNTPLEEAMVLSDRRSKGKKKGKVTKAIQEDPSIATSFEPENPLFRSIEEAEEQAIASTVRAGASIKKLAEQIIAAAEGSSERLEDVARIAEVAAIAINESRRVPIIDGKVVKAAAEAEKSAAKSAANKTTRKKATRKKATRKKAPASKASAKKAPANNDTQEDSATPGKPAAARAPRKKTTRKKSTRKKTPARRAPATSAAAKAAEAKADAEANASPDSDRLDYITSKEGQELLDGKAPSKRSRIVDSIVEEPESGDSGVSMGLEVIEVWSPDEGSDKSR